MQFARLGEAPLPPLARAAFLPAADPQNKDAPGKNARVVGLTRRIGGVGVGVPIPAAWSQRSVEGPPCRWPNEKYDPPRQGQGMGTRFAPPGATYRRWESCGGRRTSVKVFRVNGLGWAGRRQEPSDRALYALLRPRTPPLPGSSPTVAGAARAVNEHAQFRCSGLSAAKQAWRGGRSVSPVPRCSPTEALSRCSPLRTLQMA